MPRPAAKMVFRRFCLIITAFLCWNTAFPQLVADFSVDKSGGCSSLAVSFTNQSRGASGAAVYSWDFGNGNTSSLINPAAIFTDPQTYTVILRIQDGAQSAQTTKTITVYKNPVVDFSASASKGCLPLDIHFTANADPGDGQVAAYTWDFGDGTTLQGNTNSQPHSYTVPQTVTASVTVTNSFGCYTSLQKTNIIQVIPSLTASFSADKQVLCLASDPVRFSNLSTGPGTLSYLWDFGDGNTSVQANPQYAFNKKGVYSVRLTVNSSEGCTATIQQADYLNVASYKTDFDAPAIVCQNSSVTFNSLSAPTPDNSLWEVDGVQIYSYKALSYWFSTPGTHTVQLNNTFGGCQQTASKNMVVKAAPVLQPFDASSTSQCKQVSYQFADHTPGAVQWEWDFNHVSDPPHIGSTLQAPVFSFPSSNSGTYPVWLRVTNADGCSSSTSQLIVVSSPFVTIEMDGNNNSCADPVTEHFSTYSNQVLTAYNWNFGDGQTSTEPTPTHTFTGIGRYTVTLNYTTQDGCQNTATGTNLVTIAAKPNFDFKASATDVCGNTQIFFDAAPNDPNVWSWSWDFGDNQGYGPSAPNFYHTYSGPGVYSVTLYVNGICSAVIKKDNYITVRDLYARITDMKNSCDGTRGEISFAQTSTSATSISWNFGDGTTLTTAPELLTVKHNYTKSGSYLVTLSASNEKCTQTDTKTAFVLLKQYPVLSASEAVACSSDNVPIQISGLENNPQPFSYLFAYNILKLEYADSTAFDGNRNDPITGWQTVYNGSVNSFRRTDQTFHAIVESSYFNCLDTSNFITLKIQGAIPGFEVVADRVCYQSPVEFKDTSKAMGNNAILSWLWDFGDGQTASAKQNTNPSHIYKDPGSYLVTLQITDAAGCSSSTPPYNQRVELIGPEAAFNASGTLVALNSTVSFFNNSNSYGSPNSSYSWNFGDQTAVSNDFNSVHTYPVAGVYTVTLKAVNPDIACSSTATQVVVVKNFNTAFDFTTSTVSGSCPPVLVSFNNTSVNYSRITWDFGDGVTADNLPNPSHIYEKPGRYIVSLLGYAPNGLSEKHIDSIFVVSPAATVTGSPMELCIGSFFTLAAESVNTDKYLWDFGDGNVVSTDTGRSAHAYLTAGTYYPSLMMEDSNGCYGKADPATGVTVRENPVIHFSPEDPLVCRGSAVSIEASGASHYAWSPANGLSDTAIADPSASPGVSTTYKLEATDDFGCKNSGTVRVEVVQPGSLRVNPDTAVCAGNPVPMKASGEEIYEWIRTTDGLTNTQIPDPLAYPTESLQYTLTGSDGHHCFTDTAFVQVRVMPLPEVHAGQDVEIWSGESAPLSGSGSADIVQWIWTPEKYLSCADCPSPVSSPLVSTEYQLTAKNREGCLASDSVLVKIDCAAAHVSVPNIFTPNHDGRNDVFMIKGISVVKHLQIYNRWGEIVFERSNFIAGDRSACWDGNFKGMEAPTGAYVYFIEMECPSGGVFTRKGSVALIR